MYSNNACLLETCVVCDSLSQLPCSCGRAVTGSVGIAPIGPSVSEDVETEDQ